MKIELNQKQRKTLSSVLQFYIYECTHVDSVNGTCGLPEGEEKKLLCQVKSLLDTSRADKETSK